MIDGIALARIDPTRHRFAVLNEPSGKKHLEDWMRDTGAELIVNASYYDRKGAPATPVVDHGDVSGPPDYQSQHGAFVLKARQGDIRDLRGERWQELLTTKPASLVSLLLVAPDGAKRTMPSQWLANRSFIGVDNQGRVLIGTTQSAFFSLDRLADFLKAADTRFKSCTKSGWRTGCLPSYFGGRRCSARSMGVGNCKRRMENGGSCPSQYL